LTAALLFLGLAALFAFTRSHWLDDWDSVNFAFGLDDFDVTKHLAAPARLSRLYRGGKARLSCRCRSGRARSLSFPPCPAAPSLLAPVGARAHRHVRHGVRGRFPQATTTTPRGALVKRIACGFIAGLSLGARPHITLLIVLYWCLRASRPVEEARPDCSACLRPISEPKTEAECDQF